MEAFLLFCPWQEIGLLQFCERQSVECKDSAREFLLVNNVGEHLFGDVAETVELYRNFAYCGVHKQQCRVGGAPEARGADLFCAGFPCAPYSAQRNQRFAQQG